LPASCPSPRWGADVELRRVLERYVETFEEVVLHGKLRSAAVEPGGDPVASSLAFASRDPGSGWPPARHAPPPLPDVTAAGGGETSSLCRAAGDQFSIGVAIRAEQLKDPARVALILHQFNSLAGEYEFMPTSLQPEPGKFTFERADQIAAFAREHGLPLTGHMLCWYQMTPAWFYEGADHKPLSREKALANLRSHIRTVMRHFKGRVSTWIVVNEAVSDKFGEYLRDTPALRAIGDDYVQKAFEFAREADPDMPLYYNDYNLEDPVKNPKVLRLVRSLKRAGVKLGGVGIQGHWLLDYPAPGVIEAGIESLGKEGLKVVVTELDVDVLPRDGSDPYRGAAPAVLLERQARRYAALFTVFRRHRGLIPNVTLWGLEDGRSWLNDYPTKGRTNYPLLFDRMLRRKPAYNAVLDMLLKPR